MYRSAETRDLAVVCELWQQHLGICAEHTTRIFNEVAQPQNVYLAEEEGKIVGVLAAIPVTLQKMPGVYFYGAVTVPEYRHKGKAAGLFEYAKQQQTFLGKGFGVVVPRNEHTQLFWQKQGFEPCFKLRKLKRAIRRNLWAQAQFDSVTAARLGQLREKFAPQAVCLNEQGRIAEIMRLYSQGATTVETENGYGVFFENQEQLEFVELFAKSDADAEFLMQSARERTGLEQAVLTLSENSEICLGEGQLQLYGWANFWAVQPPVEMGYMRLMLE